MEDIITATIKNARFYYTTRYGFGLEIDCDWDGRNCGSTHGLQDKGEIDSLLYHAGVDAMESSLGLTEDEIKNVLVGKKVLILDSAMDRNRNPMFIRIKEFRK